MKRREVIYRVTKEIKFCAGHRLEGLGEDHPCTTQHGHNYRVKVTLEARQLDSVGFIVDFNVLSGLVKGRFDHVNLNEVMSQNPTAENLALEIGRMINELIFHFHDEERVRLSRVQVWETETCHAEALFQEIEE